MNALELKHLTKSFSDFRLDDLSLTLPSGCIMGLVGENGAGKSTVIRLILGALRADGGTVTILGRGPDQLPCVKQELGVVMDEAGIPGCLTAREWGRVMRLAYRDWDGGVFQGLLRRLSVPENKRFQELSRGNQMKLGIAAALSHHPKLLLLDEATNGLDPVARDEVVDMLADFTRDEEHSVLISSHIVSDLERICDYIAFLHKGRLMLCEEKDRLLGEYGVLRCPAQRLDELDPAAILHRRVTAWGAEAVVRRDAVPAGTEAAPVGLEELFVQMVKGES